MRGVNEIQANENQVDEKSLKQDKNIYTERTISLNHKKLNNSGNKDTMPSIHSSVVVIIRPKLAEMKYKFYQNYPEFLTTVMLNCSGWNFFRLLLVRRLRPSSRPLLLRQ